MRKHNGMRPHDIPVLLKIISKQSEPWQFKDLANELFISPAEISASLNRSVIAGLISADKKRVHRKSLMEFIEFGFRYVFPVIPGGMVNGVYTAHSHPFMKKFIESNIDYVWPDIHGKVRGLAVEPLYKGIIKASERDEWLYKMLACVDVIRVGKSREIKIAIEELKSNVLNEQS
jgi:predicted transcriptional regulator